ncbi:MULTISPECIES: ABC transporter ATP-binding protein [unclassified Microbacterium]|uniref:energy-coupling factor ABC transporter ATP-binding protein n=1 Tax=unclassified Microbacterium TaxID=2609290 RepID=UPI00214CA334|nr:MULTISPECIES: ABC transporter ATP-binding protein [unclassified Microbacterium]MCR2783885.1 energy-coupling factor ABC transporter ATP-binding protein [Microbacterium sp. zg.B96]WIM15269.1 ABC transporter ATP-binding protein [Microbacterium sp. zg-B96]
MITLSDISYAYPDAEHFALEHVDLEVAQGEIVGIVGASGAGKTTLAKIIAGFIPHVDGGELTGTVIVDGADVADLKLADAVAKVGLVIQNPFNQISGAKYTVRDEIAFGLENLGVPRAEMAQRVDAAAELLGISHLLDRSPYALSGGQQQLLAIASMVVLRTPVLVMDEPTSQLDPAGTRMVFEVLAALRDAGTTIVVFEHKVELLRQHCDRIAVIAHERVAAIGEPREILSDERLDQWGIEATRYAAAARAAVRRGILSAEIDIPVSLEEAAAVFTVGGAK